MRTKILNFSLFFIFINILCGCKDTSRHGITIIQTHGVESVFNISKTGGLFGSGNFMSKNSGIAAENEDLLSVELEKNPDLITFQYMADMGKDLNFTYDTSKPFLLLLDNKIFTVQLNDSASWDFIKSAKQESLASLNSISFTLPLNNENYEILTEISDIAPATRLIIETRSDIIGLNKVLHCSSLQVYAFLLIRHGKSLTA